MRTNGRRSDRSCASRPLSTESTAQEANLGHHEPIEAHGRSSSLRRQDGGWGCSSHDDRHPRRGWQARGVRGRRSAVARFPFVWRCHRLARCPAGGRLHQAAAASRSSSSFHAEGVRRVRGRGSGCDRCGAQQALLDQAEQKGAGLRRVLPHASACGNHRDRFRHRHHRRRERRPRIADHQHRAGAISRDERAPHRIGHAQGAAPEVRRTPAEGAAPKGREDAKRVRRRARLRSVTR